MKILLLDAGNTRLKWAVLEGGSGHNNDQNQDRDHSRLGQYDSCRYAGEDLASLLVRRWAMLPDIGRALLASVAGDAFNQNLQHCLQQCWQLQAEPLVSPAAGHGIINAYNEPQCLGIDRWLALVAARRLAAGPVCVIDCGTAVTIDWLDAQGQHLGGLILPGLCIMAQALSNGTAALPSTSASIPDMDQWPDDRLTKLDRQALARLEQDTAAAVAGGVLTTLVAGIDRIVNERVGVDGETTVMITGGDGPRLQPLLAGRYLSRPHLVLEGMAFIAEERK